MNLLGKLLVIAVLYGGLAGCANEEKQPKSAFSLQLKEFYIIRSTEDSLDRLKINSFFFRHDTLFSCIRDSNGILQYAQKVLDGNEIRQIKKDIDASLLFRMIQIHETKRDSLRKLLRLYCGPLFALRDTTDQLHFFNPLALDNLNYDIFIAWYKSLDGFTGTNSWAGAELFREKEKDLIDTMKAKLPPLPKLSTLRFVPPEVERDE